MLTHIISLNFRCSRAVRNLTNCANHSQRTRTETKSARGQRTSSEMSVASSAGRGGTTSSGERSESL